MVQTRGRCGQYLAAAETVVELVGMPEVAETWSRPSALAGWAVGGLAAHLLGQIFSVTSALATSAAEAEPIPLMTHYQRVPWRGTTLDEPANADIRAGGDETAALGPLPLLQRAQAELAELTLDLPSMPLDRVVPLPWRGWALTLDDFLTTRLMEIAVHSDDLAVSVGVVPPVLPDDVSQLVRHLLVDLAAQRHGVTAVLRALSRSERAPDTISAL
jgi:hypothetical protein